jgi:transglutaminase-like putative cysteine protease
VELHYQVRTAGADFLFNFLAAQTQQQTIVTESLTLSQNVPVYTLSTGPQARRVSRLRAIAGDLTVRYSGTVDVLHHRENPDVVAETWVSDLPGDVIPYLYPSRYCESDKLNALAMLEFGHMWQGYSRVQAICDWVNRRIAFESGSSSGTTSAEQTLMHGKGVCRDFAHLMIALCRAVNIPARFTTGLDYGADPALGPPDFHAYVEAYLGGRWYIFDPSGTAIPLGFVRITSGRDASDCAYASIFGDVVPLGRNLLIEAIPGSDGIYRAPVRTYEAISTAAS